MVLITLRDTISHADPMETAMNEMMELLQRAEDPETHMLDRIDAYLELAKRAYPDREACIAYINRAQTLIDEV